MTTVKKEQVTKAKELLGNLTAGKKPTVKKTESRTRPDLELPDNLQEGLQRFAGAFALSEVIDARVEQEKENLNSGCFSLWTERLWKLKSPGANPNLTLEKNNLPDIQSIFQVQERFVINEPEVPEDKNIYQVLIEKFSELFMDNGMDRQGAYNAATNLVNNELDVTPKTTIDLNWFVYGHYEGEGKNKTFVEATEQEQALAAKVLNLLQCRNKEELTEAEPINDEEASMLINQKQNITVKKGFLQRVCGYVNSLDQLRVIFTIVKPVKFVSKTKFAISNTPEERNHRLLQEVVNIIGMKFVPEQLFSSEQLVLSVSKLN